MSSNNNTTKMSISMEEDWEKDSILDSESDESDDEDSLDSHQLVSVAVRFSDGPITEKSKKNDVTDEERVSVNTSNEENPNSKQIDLFFDDYEDENEENEEENDDYEDENEENEEEKEENDEENDPLPNSFKESAQSSHETTNSARVCLFLLFFFNFFRTKTTIIPKPQKLWKSMNIFYHIFFYRPQIRFLLLFKVNKIQFVIQNVGENHSTVLNLSDWKSMI